MTSSLVVGGLVTLAPHANAAVNTCRARNVTKDRPSRLNLQLVIDAADPGDTVAVRYVCVGNFTIAKDLRLVGTSTGDAPRPVLSANGEGRVLTVSGDVRLANLAITGGVVSDAVYPLENNGGGILNDGILRLHDTVVRGNRANDHGGGIYNSSTGTLTLNAVSWVHGNRSDRGGGIANFGTTNMNGSSSVNGNAVRHFYHNRYGGGIYNEGVLTMNDSSSVRGNRGYYGHGCGIFNDNGTITLNDSSTVRGNRGISGSVAGGIDNSHGVVTLNDRSSVRGNTSSHLSGGIFNRRGTVTLKGSSSVTHNTTGGSGGGIYNFSGTVTLDGRSSVTRNTAGSAGGIYNLDHVYVCSTWRGAISPNKPNDPPTPTVISC
jgi:hypothetical protein